MSGRDGTGDRTAAWLKLLAVVLLALNLRIAIAGLAPLLPDVQADLGLGRGAAGLLTSLPVLCFGLLSAYAALLGRWIGMELALLLALLGIGVGSLIRIGPSAPWMLIGTAVIGAAITVGNVLMPSIVKQHFPRREGVVTGLTTAALTAGPAVAAAVAAPLAYDAGLGWRGSLLVLGGFAAVAALPWLPRSRHRHAAPLRRSGGWALLRSPVTWYVAGFMAMQSLLFYSMLAWLPTLLRDGGVSAAGAGWALGLFNLLGIATALAVPALAARRRDQRSLGLLTCAGWGAGLVGLHAAPSLYLLWTVLTGLAQGAGIALALALIVIRARSPESSRDLSGVVQSVGYLVAAPGPVLVGVLRDVSGGWSAPIVALGVAAVLMALSAIGAGRDRRV